MMSPGASDQQETFGVSLSISLVRAWTDAADVLLAEAEVKMQQEYSFSWITFGKCCSPFVTTRHLLNHQYFPDDD